MLKLFPHVGCMEHISHRRKSNSSAAVEVSKFKPPPSHRGPSAPPTFDALFFSKNKGLPYLTSDPCSPGAPPRLSSIFLPPPPLLPDPAKEK